MPNTRRCAIWMAAILVLTLALAASTMAGATSEVGPTTDPVDVTLEAVTGSCLPEIGQRLIVDVMVYDVEHLNGAEFYIHYDPTVLEVMDSESAEEGVQISAGAMFAPYGRATERTVDEDNDLIVYAHQLASYEVSGTGAIARIFFEVLDDKDTTLEFVDPDPARTNWLALHPAYYQYPNVETEIPATWHSQEYVSGCSVLYLPRVSGR